MNDLTYDKPIRYKLTAVIFGSLILSGCGSLLDPVKVPETTTYQITQNKDMQVKPIPKPQKGTIRIEAMQSASPYDSTNMYYTLNNYEIKPYAYSRWVSQPQNMLNRILLETINHANLYQNTVSSSYLGKTNYNLSTTLLELNQHMYGINTYTSMKVLAQLSERQSGKILKQHLFNIEAMANASPTGMAYAVNESAKLLAAQMVAWLDNKPISSIKFPVANKQNNTTGLMQSTSPNHSKKAQQEANEFYQL